MSWTHGDEAKQPPECKTLGRWKMKCPNLKEMDPKNMEGETYSCEVCGEYVYLDYEEMR
jgi:hypothetical protein